MYLVVLHEGGGSDPLAPILEHGGMVYLEVTCEDPITR